jgi:hypothetical protein
MVSCVQQRRIDADDIPPISVCLAVGFSSAYWHICLRSKSVKVFLGVEPDRDEVAEIGVGRGARVMGCIGCTGWGYAGWKGCD